MNANLLAKLWKRELLRESCKAQWPRLDFFGRTWVPNPLFFLCIDWQPSMQTWNKNFVWHEVVL